MRLGYERYLQEQLHQFYLGPLRHREQQDRWPSRFRLVPNRQRLRRREADAAGASGDKCNFGAQLVAAERWPQPQRTESGVAHVEHVLERGDLVGRWRWHRESCRSQRTPILWTATSISEDEIAAASRRRRRRRRR